MLITFYRWNAVLTDAANACLRNFLLSRISSCHDIEGTRSMSEDQRVHQFLISLQSAAWMPSAWQLPNYGVRATEKLGAKMSGRKNILA